MTIFSPSHPFDPESESANEEDFEPLGVRPCDPVPHGFPEAWRRASMCVSVGLILVGHNCVTRSFFREFAVGSVPEAIERLWKCREEHLTYVFTIVDATPAFAYDCDWPLLRRGRNAPFRREKVQGVEPWVWRADRTVFEVRNEPIGIWRSRPYLRVGGRTPEQAVANWNTCAPVLRGLYRRSRSEAAHGSKPESKS